MQHVTRKSLQLFFLVQLLLSLVGLGSVFISDWHARGWTWLVVGTMSVMAYVTLLLIQTLADPPTVLFPKPVATYPAINSFRTFVKTDFFVNVSAVLAIFLASIVLVVGMNPPYLNLRAFSQSVIETLVLLILASYNLWILWRMQK